MLFELLTYLCQLYYNTNYFRDIEKQAKEYFLEMHDDDDELKYIRVKISEKEIKIERINVNDYIWVNDRVTITPTETRPGIKIQYKNAVKCIYDEEEYGVNKPEDIVQAIIKSHIIEQEGEELRIRKDNRMINTTPIMFNYIMEKKIYSDNKQLALLQLRRVLKKYHQEKELDEPTNDEILSIIIENIHLAMIAFIQKPELLKKMTRINDESSLELLNMREDIRDICNDILNTHMNSRIANIERIIYKMLPQDMQDVDAIPYTNPFLYELRIYTVEDALNHEDYRSELTQGDEFYNETQPFNWNPINAQYVPAEAGDGAPLLHDIQNGGYINIEHEQINGERAKYQRYINILDGKDTDDEDDDELQNAFN